MLTESLFVNASLPVKMPSRPWDHRLISMDGYIIARYAQTLDALLLMGEPEQMTVLPETRAVSDSSYWDTTPTYEKPEEYIAGTFVYSADLQMPEDRIARLSDSFQSGGLKLAVQKNVPWKP